MHVIRLIIERFVIRRVFSSISLLMLATLTLGPMSRALAAQGESQQTFTTPAEAARALFSAVSDDDESALRHILGAASELKSDDELQDKLDRQKFAQKYQQMHRFAREGDDMMLLYVGAENWPFPVPLVSQNGRWRFDPQAGREEIRFRRIGENEITAIALCRAFMARVQHPEVAPNPDLDPAVLSNANSHPTAPVRGYYFRTVRGSGDAVTIIAYPAEYRSSGVMTFIVNSGDVVRQKDLGEDTAQIARALNGATDATWTSADAS